VPLVELQVGGVLRFVGLIDLPVRRDGTLECGLPWRSLAGVIAHTLGDEQGAQAYIEQEIALAREFQVPVQLGIALRRRALIEDGRTAIRTLEEATAALEQTDAALELGRALTDLGAAYRRARRGVACREPLRRALDLAHRCAATALEERARAELLASGARPRRAAVAGIGALTPSERRIAGLAANGLSNREIAETAFLTTNTVRWHLANVYRKLDVDSRRQLAAKLAG
jgi:DNA-binding CsgD family transcriptional regulator